MTQYYDAHPFTPAQAEHAVDVVTKLIRERRFFLYRPEKPHEEDLGYVLDPTVFSSVIEIDRALQAAYKHAKTLAETTIIELERSLGIAKPNLGGNKQIVQCNRYTGGFDICRVYPLTAFAAYASNSETKIIKERFQHYMGLETADEISPKEFRAREEKAQLDAMMIDSQLESLRLKSSKDPRCVVLLQSRFPCSDSSQGDFAGRKLLDIQKYPFALGYLFHAYSNKTRVVRNDYVVFGTSRESHVSMQHMSGKKPSICYEQKGGYENPVMFATVL